jgi:plasmid stabilization system protein ParE
MMPLAVRLRPDVLSDLRDATAWYEAASPGLGAEFQQAFFDELERIAAAPLMHRALYRDFRRLVMPRFPYLIYFRVEADGVVIYLLIHSARDPVLLRSLLSQR